MWYIYCWLSLHTVISSFVFVALLLWSLLLDSFIAGLLNCLDMTLVCDNDSGPVITHDPILIQRDPLILSLTIRYWSDMIPKFCLTFILIIEPTLKVDPKDIFLLDLSWYECSTVNSLSYLTSPCLSAP